MVRAASGGYRDDAAHGPGGRSRCPRRVRPRRARSPAGLGARRGASDPGRSRRRCGQRRSRSRSRAISTAPTTSRPTVGCRARPATSSATDRRRSPTTSRAGCCTPFWSSGLGNVPPRVLPYLLHPWVVANDRLRAQGWAPVHSNESAILASPPLESALTARRRAALTVAAVAGTAGAGFGVARVARRVKERGLKLRRARR